MKEQNSFETWPIKKLADLQLNKKIHLDLDFQSPARWGPKNKQEFMVSSLRGFTPMPVIIAHISSCKNYCEETYGTNSADYQYFDRMHDSGYEWISVDGNNRTITLADFFNDKLKLKKNTYRILVSNPKFKVWETQTDTSYSGLPDNLRECIDTEITIPVHAVLEADRQDLHNLFIRVNSGIALNPQEKRNAIVVPIADTVRDYGNRFEPMFSKYFTPKARNRRQHEEFIVSMFVQVTRGFNTGISVDQRNNAYTSNSAEHANTTRVREILKQMDRVVSHDSSKGKLIGKQATLFDLVMLVDHLTQEGISIIDYEEFLIWFSRTIKRHMQSNNFVINGSDPRTYYGAQRSMDAKFRKARLTTLIKELDNITSGVLSVKKDKKRFADREYCLELWERQDRKCALTGKAISFKDVFDGSKTHIDHIVEHTHGGQTQLDNLQLVFAHANQPHIKSQLVNSN